ncbi:MAG TPA: hypothetical protein VJB38_04640 [Bacteroidota bacterium]|nr:hypothetical protein [Bacteroidota bacterium]
MTKNTILLFSMLLTFVLGCTPPPPSGPEPDHIVFLDDGDSLTCKLLLGEIMFTRAVSAQGDTLSIDNASIDRIVHMKTGRDVTDRYIDREALKVELMKKETLAKREKLKADIAAGKKKKSELDRIPFAVLSASMEPAAKGVPQVSLTILNLSGKKISLVKTKIYCFNEKGQPISGTKGRNHVFDASSRIPIGPGEDFTTTLALRNHPKTKRARIEIHYLEFSDHTWWKGKVEEAVE